MKSSLLLTMLVAAGLAVTSSNLALGRRYVHSGDRFNGRNFNAHN